MAVHAILSRGWASGKTGLEAGARVTPQRMAMASPFLKLALELLCRTVWAEDPCPGTRYGFRIVFFRESLAGRREMAPTRSYRKIMLPQGFLLRAQLHSRNACWRFPFVFIFFGTDRSGTLDTCAAASAELKFCPFFVSRSPYDLELCG
jgi:hypothetical protein